MSSVLQRPKWNHQRRNLRSLAFSEAEYQRRLNAVQEELGTREYDALISTFLPNVAYLSGFETIAALQAVVLVVPREGEPALLTDEFEIYNAYIHCWIDDLFAFPWSETSTGALCELLRLLGLDGKRLAWEQAQWNHTLGQYQAVSEIFEAEWSYEWGIIESIRSVKANEEIEKLRRAAQISVAGMRAAMGALEEGARTDGDVAAAAYCEMLRLGSERFAIQPIVTSGKYSGVPHSSFAGRPIGSGDAVLIEVGGCVNRYSAPLMRTPVIETPPDGLWLQMLRACQEAVDRTIGGMRPGAEIGALAEYATEPLDGLQGDVFRDGNRGYSVGLGFEPSWEDIPSVQIATREWSLRPSRTAESLRAGEVYHVRAATRAVGRFAAAVSETVTVTTDGAEVLTSDDRELRVISKERDMETVDQGVSQ